MFLRGMRFEPPRAGITASLLVMGVVLMNMSDCGTRAALMKEKVIDFSPACAPSSGLGHLRRCLNVYRALPPEFQGQFVIDPEHQAARAHCASLGVPVGEVAQGLGVVVDKCDAVHLADPVALGGSVQKLRAQGHQVALIDGVFKDRLPLSCNGDPDLLLQPYLCAAQDTPYEKGRWLAGGYVVLLGRDYMDLGPPEQSVAPRVLISFGGTDPTQLTSQLLQLLPQCPDLWDVPIVGIIGPHFSSQNTEACRKAAQALPRCRLVTAPDTLISYLQQADIAVIGSGANSRYEAACAGAIPLVIEQSPDHARQCRADAEAGLGLHLGAFEQISALVLNETFKRLASGVETRNQMAQHAKKLLVGNGLLVVAQALQDLVLHANNHN